MARNKINQQQQKVFSGLGTPEDNDLIIYDSGTASWEYVAIGELGLISAEDITVRDDGISIRGSISPTIGDPQDSYILIEDSEGNDIASIGFVVSAGLRIINRNHGGAITLLSEDSGGSLKTLVNADPAGSSSLYHAGAPSFTTRDDGATFRGSVAPATGGTQDSFVDLLDSAGAVIGRFGFPASPNLVIRSYNDGATVGLAGLDSSSTNQNLFVGDPDGAATSYYAGTSVARTAAAASGGLEANNTATGAGFERVLTASDINGRAVIKQGDTTRTSTTTLTADPDLVLTLAPGWYAVEAVLFTSSPSTAGGSKLVLDGVTGSGSFNPITNNTPALWGLGDDFGTSAGVGPTSGGSAQIVSGYVEVTSTSDLELQWAQATSDANGLTLREGSHLTARKIA